LIVFVACLHGYSGEQPVSLSNAVHYGVSFGVWFCRWLFCATQTISLISWSWYFVLGPRSWSFLHRATRVHSYSTKCVQFC